MRYQRQMLMKEIGKVGQEKLAQSKVTVIGAGGLGSPVLTYLAAAGVGSLVIVDADVVSETNLNRQFLHQVQDMGRNKALSASEKLLALRPDLNLRIHQVRLTADNREEILGDAQLIVDCVDNPATRKLVNDFALQRDIPLIEGGIRGFYGFVMLTTRHSACLECLGYHNASFESPTPVLGATAGVVGSLQANMAIQWILGMKEEKEGYLIQYDGLLMELERIPVQISPLCEAHNSALQQTKDSI